MKRMGRRKMNKQDFENSWRGNSPQKKPLSMFVARIQLECSCNKLFFTTLATTELEGDFVKRCPLCRRTHKFAWVIQTKTDEDIEEENNETT